MPQKSIRMLYFNVLSHLEIAQSYDRTGPARGILPVKNFCKEPWDNGADQHANTSMLSLWRVMLALGNKTVAVEPPEQGGI